MIVQEIIQAIEDFAPLAYQESYDNAGLLIGSPQQEITSALLTIDVTPEVIDEAVTVGANCIIAHHPFIFSGLKHVRGENDVERCVVKAIQYDIAIYAAHTNLDSVFYGVNYKIAQKLNLQQLHILQPTENNSHIGNGMIGCLEKSMPVRDFLEQVKQTFSCKFLKTSPLCNHVISRVSLCGGSGSFLIEQAKKQKADVFLTADVKYHDFFSAENQIIIVDFGHYESEQFTKDIFYEILNKKFPTFALHFSKITTNPINYI
ncbi:MAG: Nif3-like dinuclear metal center hexameric protein [Bacteroidales bacterium]|jgi:dinuclear metal center YbgI/SA1388 family protein|nr:Nif3-like dinuclear metal center hexameric protein [Bacteroidales bacterium]